MAGVPGLGLGTSLKPFYRENLALALDRNFKVKKYKKSLSIDLFYFIFLLELRSSTCYRMVQ